MRNLFSAALAAVLMITTGFAQTKLIEKVTAKPGEVVIPYEKYELPNGLTLIIHEDHSDPIVRVDVTYHVGSAREEIGKSGFAHFFEHMMFQGSENVADEEHFKIVTESGGTLNGTTNRDRTNYFETVPSNQLETALWLEADRMGFLLDAVTQKKFEVQRATVKNERGQNYDNRPYGLVGETVSKNLYPYGHPYSWLTIGYVEDLDRVDVEDLKRFFLRWYGPNNATLTVGGDVKPAEVIKLAEKYFGSIPRGPEVKNMAPMVPEIITDRYVTMEDKIRSPHLQMTFPVPQMYHADIPALECLAEIIGGSDYSILEQNFVKTQKASRARAYVWDSELAGEFTIYVRAFPETDLTEMEKDLRKSLQEFGEKGVSDEDIERFKAGWEYNFINSLSSVSRKVGTLAYHETFSGNPNKFREQIEAFRKVTKEDVMRVYKKYIEHEACVVLSVIPEGEFDLEAHESNYVINHMGYEKGKDEYANLQPRKAKDNFDRSKRPAPGENPSITVPEFWESKLSNGIRVIGTKMDELPMTTIQISVEGGHLMEIDKMEKSGVAELTANMLGESTRKRSKEEFEQALDKLRGSIWIWGGGNNTSIILSAMNEDLDQIIDLAAERLYEPAFLDDEFERLKKRHVEGIREGNMRPSTIAMNIFSKVMYGKNHIQGIPSSGTEETAENIELADVIEYYRKNFSANLVTVMVVGDIDQAEAMKKLEFLTKMKDRGTEIPEIPLMAPVGNTKIYVVNKEGAPQTEIRMGYPAMKYDATGEYYKADLMNYPLGGMFNSRINLNLREDKGYTYGARSGFRGSQYNGYFSAGASVRVEATDSAVTEFITEIENFRDNGITEEELAFMKQSIGQREALEYESSWQKASFLRRIMLYDLDKNFIDEQNQILADLTKAEVDALAKKYLKPEQMSILCVGDKEKILPGLEKLGYEIIELDLDGNPIGESGAEGGK